MTDYQVKQIFAYFVSSSFLYTVTLYIKDMYPENQHKFQGHIIHYYVQDIAIDVFYSSNSKPVKDFFLFLFF